MQKEIDLLRNDSSETTQRLKENFEKLKNKHNQFVE